MLYNNWSFLSVAAQLPYAKSTISMFLQLSHNEEGSSIRVESK